MHNKGLDVKPDTLLDAIVIIGADIMINPHKDIDWNEVWKEQMKQNRASGPGRDCARIWESRDSAQRFWNMCQEERRRIDKTIWETDTTTQSRVLDIGAGPGTLAIPFAQKVAHVTAVEPADGMVGVMQEKMAEFGAQNISVVQKRWEDVDVKRDLQPPYDVVIASFSLGMMDIQTAIEKMAMASSKYVYLYHFAGETSWDRMWSDLWPKLHGVEYNSGPKCDVLYNVLYHMGIYPHIHTFRLQHNQRYSSVEEAASALWPQAQADTGEKKAILRDFLARNLQEENGALVLPGSSIRVKMWWQK
ncbi:putative cobalt-precorrin-6B C(15)-methyltransferase (decarboxylating) [uncultured archaeon]|nr:putative cobalt-precorrin-6B C(15)-methyltransferase (decarboxylating) [uncultured archaeon]